MSVKFRSMKTADDLRKLDVRKETVAMPEHFLTCLWVLEDCPEPADTLELVRALTRRGVWAGLAWTVALSWTHLLPDVRRAFVDGGADLCGWLNTLISWWPQVII